MPEEYKIFEKEKVFITFFTAQRKREKKHIKEKLFSKKKESWKMKSFPISSEDSGIQKPEQKLGDERRKTFQLLFPSKFIVRLLFSKLRASMKEIGLGAKKEIGKKRRQKSLMNFEGSIAME